MGVAHRAGAPYAPLRPMLLLKQVNTSNSMRAKLKRAVRKPEPGDPTYKQGLVLGQDCCLHRNPFLLVPNSVIRGDPYPFTLSAHVVRSGRGAMGAPSDVQVTVKKDHSC